MYEDADIIATKLRLAVRRERHNALVEVEEFCTGTVSKLKRYAPLLRHLAKLKESIRIEMHGIEWQVAMRDIAAQGGKE